MEYSDQNMGYMRYSRVSSRGFKLNPRRVCVQRLRTMFIFLFRLFERWRCSYGQALRLLKKVIPRGKNSNKRRSLLISEESQIKDRSTDQCGLRSLRRSNSFYAEAIADCLEFIKRSSIPVDDQNPVIHSLD